MISAYRKEGFRMALDARVRYTKMMINEAFIHLIEEKPFERITLKEVCNLAGINRSTFYKYYKDIYDWREQMEKSCMESAQKLMDEVDSTDIEVILTHLFRSVKEDNDLFHALFSANGGCDSHSLEQLFSMGLNKGKLTFEHRLLENPSEAEKWKIHFLAYGSIGVIQCWIREGMKQPPEEVAKYIADILKKA